MFLQELGLKPSRTLSQNFAMLRVDLWYRRALFLRGAIRLTDCDHDLRLLSGQITSTRRPATTADFREVLARGTRKGNSFALYTSIVSWLRCYEQRKRLRGIWLSVYIVSRLR